MAELMTMKRKYGESIADFSYRIQKFSMQLDCSVAEKDNYCRSVFINSLPSNLRRELIKYNRNLTFIEVVNFATKLEKYLPNNDDTKSHRVEKIKKNSNERVNQSKDRTGKDEKTRSHENGKYKKPHRFGNFLPISESNSDFSFKRQSAGIKSKVNQVTNSKKLRQILTEGQCSGENACLFIDCGSAISLVSTRFVDKISKSHKIKPANISLTSFTQDKIEVKGQIKISVKIAGINAKHKFIVSDLVENDFLIGMDFLTNNEIVIDIPSKALKTNFGKSKFIEKPGPLYKSRKIKVSKIVTLQPNTVNFVKAEIKGKIPNEKSHYEGIIEPYTNFAVNTGILVGSTWSYSKGKQITVQCINMSDQPVTIYRNQLIGFFEPVKNKPFHSVSKIEACKKSYEKLGNELYVWQVQGE